MDNVKAIFLMLTIILFATSTLLFIQGSAYKARLNDADRLSESTLSLLRTQGIPCNAFAADYTKIISCIKPALSEKDFKEDSFVQPDEKKGTKGVLVISNVNIKPYDAESLNLLVNRALAQEGCDNIVEGRISKGVTCRFTLPGRCEKGDVLEVIYRNATDSNKVFTKTC